MSAAQVGECRSFLSFPTAPYLHIACTRPPFEPHVHEAVAVVRTERAMGADDFMRKMPTAHVFMRWEQDVWSEDGAP